MASGLHRGDRVLRDRPISRVSAKTALYRMIENAAVAISIRMRCQQVYRQKFARRLPPGENRWTGLSRALGRPRFDLFEDRFSRLTGAGVVKEETLVARGAEILGIGLKKCGIS